MKKLVLTLICVLAVLGVKAQSHSFRDTIEVRYEQFDYDAWVMQDPVHNGKAHLSLLYPYTNMSLGDDDVLQYNYTGDPNGMEVIGLSAAVQFFHGHLSPNVPAEYLLLYEATPDSFILKARMQWDETDTAGRPDGKYLFNQLSCQNPDSLHGLDTFSGGRASGIKIFDLYFDADKPIVVYDSFYVGGTARFFMYSIDEVIPWSLSFYLSFFTSYGATDTECYSPALWKMYHYSGGYGVPTNQWHWRRSNQFLMILPIIRVVDTSLANAPECPRVNGLFLRGNYTDTVTMQWAQDGLHQEFEVSYGRAGTEPEDGTIVSLNNLTYWQFTDSAYTDTPMVSYVRTVCREYDTLRWSRWSIPMYWRLHHETTDTSHIDTTQHEGITLPDDRSDLSRYVQLLPNPASENVTVMSSYGIEGLEVYDVRGERVLGVSGVDRRTSTGFDVTGWTKGTYVVLVRTPAGTIAKRLVVN